MSEITSKVIHGDCLEIFDRIDASTIDLVYLDPPFFTNRRHSGITRDRSKRFHFDDTWNGLQDYAEFIKPRLCHARRVLKNSGSIFVHCDTSANFLLRTLLDSVFGDSQFRSEIIWTYRRWSNSAKGLMPSHQTILHYSKTSEFKFNKMYIPYSETTNIDQILQLRGRDEHGVASYATDENGEVIFGGEKKGVPLGDVWEIPFLNPKAKERTGYPTQKPVTLLERIIEISTVAGDIVLDPFCGSGTTLVAAKILGRHSIGIDNSMEAVELARRRILEPIKTDSLLMKKGRSAFANADATALAVLQGVDFLPVQRNAGIDAFVKAPANGLLVPVRVQRDTETLTEAAGKLVRAIASKNFTRAILIRTHHDEGFFPEPPLPSFLELLDSTALQIEQRLPDIIKQMLAKRVS